MARDFGYAERKIVASEHGFGDNRCIGVLALATDANGASNGSGFQRPEGLCFPGDVPRVTARGGKVRRLAVQPSVGCKGFLRRR